jgi:hypothetical protein
MPEVSLSPGCYKPRDLLAAHGLARSKSDAERLLRQRAVKKDGVALEAGAQIVATTGSFVISVGPSRFCRFLVLGKPPLPPPSFGSAPGQHGAP